MGRHRNIDCFYIGQTHSKIPKTLIRDNTNFLIIFKQDSTNLHHIYKEHVNSDMSFKSFHKMCNKCWKSKHDFLVIDKDKPLTKGRYKRTFNEYIVI